jgi:hypothetical protein
MLLGRLTEELNSPRELLLQILQHHSPIVRISTGRAVSGLRPLFLPKKEVSCAGDKMQSLFRSRGLRGAGG